MNWLSGLRQGLTGCKLPTESLELIVAAKVDHDSAAAFAGLSDRHLRAQRGAQFLLKRGELPVARFAASGRLRGGPFIGDNC
jgi:hypothetical protein